MQGPKSRYGERLLDPRWQKMRLQVLERDGWTCRSCGANDKTLHVHHIAYYSGADPWDTDDSLLLTLCAECHEVETADHQDSVAALLSLLADMGVVTAFDLHTLTNDVHDAFCKQRTGDWAEAWRAGVACRTQSSRERLRALWVGARSGG